MKREKSVREKRDARKESGGKNDGEKIVDSEKIVADVKKGGVERVPCEHNSNIPPS